MGLRNGIQQRIVFVSFFACFFDLLLCSSREDEELHPPFGKPVFLCLGRACLRAADVVLYDIGLLSWIYD